MSEKRRTVILVGEKVCHWAFVPVVLKCYPQRSRFHFCRSLLRSRHRYHWTALVSAAMATSLLGLLPHRPLTGAQTGVELPGKQRRCCRPEERAARASGIFLMVMLPAPTKALPRMPFHRVLASLLSLHCFEDQLYSLRHSKAEPGLRICTAGSLSERAQVDYAMLETLSCTRKDGPSSPKKNANARLPDILIRHI